MDIRISPEELQEHSKNIVKETMKIRELIEQIESAVNSLSGWQSANKDMFVNNVRNDIKDMNRMVEAAESYGLVGGDVAARVLGVENSIREQLIKENSHI